MLLAMEKIMTPAHKSAIVAMMLPTTKAPSLEVSDTAAAEEEALTLLLLTESLSFSRSKKLCIFCHLKGPSYMYISS